MKSETFDSVLDNLQGVLPSEGRVLLGVGAPLGLLPMLPANVVADVESGTLSIKSEIQLGHLGSENYLHSSRHNVGINNFFNFWTKKIKYDAVILEALEVDKQTAVNVDNLGVRHFGGRGGAVAALKNTRRTIILPTLGRDSFVEKVSVESYCVFDCTPEASELFVVFPDRVEQFR